MMLHALLLLASAPIASAAVLPEVFLGAGSRLAHTKEARGIVTSRDAGQWSYPVLSAVSQWTMKMKSKRYFWRVAAGGDMALVSGSTPILWSARASVSPYRLLYPKNPGWFALSPRLEFQYEKLSHKVSYEVWGGSDLSFTQAYRQTELFLATLKADFEFQMGSNLFTLTPHAGRTLIAKSSVPPSTSMTFNPHGWRFGVDSNLQLGRYVFISMESGYYLLDDEPLSIKRFVGSVVAGARLSLPVIK